MAQQLESTPLDTLESQDQLTLTLVRQRRMVGVEEIGEFAVFIMLNC